MAETLSLNIKGPSDTKLAVSVPADASVADLKAAVEAADSSFPKDQQRLIFSGRVLKDEDPISKYGIKNGVAIHLVKGARPAGAAAARSSEASGVPSSFAAGQQVAGNPLAPLLNAQNAGAFGGFNPFAEMGVNPNDPNLAANLMNSPQAQAQMNALLSDPAMVDQIIASNPQLAAMGPQVRQMMQSEHFRSMLTNPQLMQQMAGMMGGGAGGAGGAFPSPGAFGWGSGQQQGGGQAATGGANPALFNPWASAPAAGEGAVAGTGGAGSPPPANPFAAFGGGGGGAGGMDPMQALAQLNQLQQMFGGGGAGGGGGGAPAQQESPEVRFAAELQQLRDMGFTDATRNVRALLAAGGYVESAIAWLFENP